jgi:hypothetical protein
MTLTKGDLSAIRGAIKEEIRTETRKVVRAELSPIVKKINKNFIYLKKRFDELFIFLDKKYIEVKKDVRVIQSHIRLPVTDF